MVLGWLCCGLRSGEASTMERHSDGETEMRDERDGDKIIFFFFLQYCYSAILPLELHCSSIAKKFAIPGFTIP